VASLEQQGGWRDVAAAAARIAAAIADAAGHLAAFVLLLLTIGIVLGITLRWIDIDNSWTYDFVLFTLVWVAFVGAVFTARRDRHVTAGIALEHVFGGRGTVLSILRFAIVGGFLVLFAISGERLALESFRTGETTVDVVQWQVWIAEAALPIGAVLWLVAEAAKFLRRVAGLGPETTAAIDSTDLAGE
jgi:TRAP-type C4-dicarboxylate transport system permease small subunit